MPKLPEHEKIPVVPPQGYAITKRGLLNFFLLAIPFVLCYFSGLLAMTIMKLTDIFRQMIGCGTPFPIMKLGGIQICTEEDMLAVCEEYRRAYAATTMLKKIRDGVDVKSGEYGGIKVIRTMEELREFLAERAAKTEERSTPKTPDDSGDPDEGDDPRFNN